MNIDCFDLEKSLKNKGKKQNGYINIAVKPDSTWVRIPVMIVNGIEDGPTMLVDGCQHGDEYEGTESIIRVVKELDPLKLKGTFIGVPVVNIDAFSFGQRVSPIDFSHTDLNRAYPGNENSFITHLIAKTYMDSLVKKADYLITLHGGGNYLYLEPISLYQETVDEVGKASFEMAKAFGTKLLWKTDPLPNGGILDEECHKLGIPTITPQIGGQCVRHSEREHSNQLCKRGIINVMKKIGMLDGAADETENQINVDITYIRSKSGGIHIPLKRPLEDVKRGELLAKVTNIFGEVIEEVVAPFDGIVIGYWTYPVIQPQNWSYLFGKVL